MRSIVAAEKGKESGSILLGHMQEALLARPELYLLEYAPLSVFTRGNVAHSKQRISRVQYDSINFQKEILACGITAEKHEKSGKTKNYRGEVARRNSAL